ncbi:MAG: restriction endonuclease subunit S [Candidatus Hodarchaeales archaeon]
MMIQDTPISWKIINLNDICVKITDGEHIKPKYVKKGIPFLTAKNVTSEGLDFTDISYISEEDAKKSWNRCHPEKGDILIVSRGATIGRSSIVNVEKSFCLLGSVILIKLKSGLNSKYIYYLLKSNELKRNMLNLSSSTAQQAIYLRDIRNLNIPVPPFNEQVRIVEKIEELFTRLDQGTKTLQYCKNHLLTYKKSIIRESFIPKSQDWKSKKIAEVTRTTSGGTPKRTNSSYFGGDIPWLKSGELNDGDVFSSEEYITQLGLENSSAKIFPVNTLLIALYGATVGKLGILKLPAATNQAICGITPYEQLDLKFLFWYLYSIRSELLRKRIGGAQPNISQTILKEIDVPLPTLNEQKRIVKNIELRVSIVDGDVSSISESINKTRLMKQSILKRAFSGQLVTHNPSDEPASVLLRKIKSEKPKTKRRRKN